MFNKLSLTWQFAVLPVGFVVVHRLSSLVFSSWCRCECLNMTDCVSCLNENSWSGCDLPTSALCVVCATVFSSLCTCSYIVHKLTLLSSGSKNIVGITSHLQIWMCMYVLCVCLWRCVFCRVQLQWNRTRSWTHWVAPAYMKVKQVELIFPLDSLARGKCVSKVLEMWLVLCVYVFMYEVKAG